jgi:hypothetical protein
MAAHSSDVESVVRSCGRVSEDCRKHGPLITVQGILHREPSHNSERASVSDVHAQ